MTLTKSATLNYSDIFYSFFTNNDSICHDKAKYHYLVYVYSGEMILEEDSKEISIRSGQCVFIRRDHRVNFTKRTIGEEPFKSISLVFNRNFLRKYYQKFQPDTNEQEVQPLKSSILRLPATPNLESLFLSMKPYFETEQEPQPELIDLKMQEGILSLLAINKAFSLPYLILQNHGKLTYLIF